MDSLFSPLDKSYCLYFYFLAVMGLFLFIFSLVGAVYMMATSKLDTKFYAQILMVVPVYALMYLQNRILWSMCIKSL